jgi:ribosome biogenesis GTPase
VLAANVDRLWIVHGLDVPANLRRLERYLAVGWESGASPELVLTKSDLASQREESVAAVREIAFGVPLWVVSKSDHGALGSLRDSLESGSTVALMGPSGVGKSTLINLLAQSDVAQTGEVRAGDRKGRHTTTSREVIRIHNDALLLDTPGLRELRVLTLDEGLGRAFPEIEDLAGKCRFRDCSHQTEPGCAVLLAVEEGTLAADRLASFRKLEAAAEYERRKSDPRAMAEAVAEYKTAMKTLKYHPKHQRDG